MKPLSSCILLILALYSCSFFGSDGIKPLPDSTMSHRDIRSGTEQDNPVLPVVDYRALQAFLIAADSVVLLSHHSPNMPIKDPKTGKYYRNAIPFIVDGKINYRSSVQERKRLNKKQIAALSNLLSKATEDSGPRPACFQPRNAVAAFKDGKLTCYDFCFECAGVARYGIVVSEVRMDSEK
jgi:hypothetical protein